MTEKSTPVTHEAPPEMLTWRTTGGEVFALSGWHDAGMALVYSFVPGDDRWKNRSTRELADMDGAESYATLDDAKAWAEHTERESSLSAHAETHQTPTEH